MIDMRLLAGRVVCHLDDALPVAAAVWLLVMSFRYLGVEYGWLVVYTSIFGGAVFGSTFYLVAGLLAHLVLAWKRFEALGRD